MRRVFILLISTVASVTSLAHAQVRDVPVTPTPVPIATIHFEPTINLSTYIVNMPTLPPLPTNDASVMLKHIAAHRVTPTQRIYVDTRTVQEPRRAALHSSLEIANRAQQPPLPLHFIDEGLEPLTSNDASREHFAISYSGTTSDGDYYERADVRVDGQSFTLTVTCRVRAAVRAFMNLMKSYFFGAAQPRTNTIAIVNHVRRQIAADFHESEDAIIVKFKDQLSRTHFVQLRQPRDIIAQ